MLTTGIFRSRWWMVVAAVLGLTLNTGVVQTFAFSVFLKPITADLGISRGTLTAATFLGAPLALVTAPLFGKAIDYFGLRVVHLPMIAAYAVATAMLSLLRMPFAAMVVLFVCHGFFGQGQSPVAYSKGIAASFGKDRGLALGIAISGVGLGVAIIPPYESFLIQHYGWRVAFVGEGIAMLVLAFVPVLLFEREPPVPPERRRTARDQALPGAGFLEAVLGWRFWAMTIAFFIAIVAINGVVSQIVALLTDRGMSLAAAVGALSLSGIALTGGRILSGFCLDRVHGPYVAVTVFAASGVGIALLAAGVTPYLGTMLCGLGIGAEVDIMAYFVSRYFGLKSFGAIYGLMFALFAFGVSSGPPLMGQAFDRFHSYEPMMILFEAMLALSCILLLLLGPYRFAVERR
jgi:MFS family permease